MRWWKGGGRQKGSLKFKVGLLIEKTGWGYAVRIPTPGAQYSLRLGREQEPEVAAGLKTGFKPSNTATVTSFSASSIKTFLWHETWRSRVEREVF